MEEEYGAKAPNGQAARDNNSLLDPAINSNADVTVEIIKLESAVSKSSRLRSLIWKHFKRRDDGKWGTCQYCGKTFRTLGGSTTNLKRHLVKAHPEILDDSVEEIKPPISPKKNNSKQSFIWDHFERVDENKGKCGFCEKVINAASSGNLKRHLLKKHEDLYNEIYAEMRQKKRPMSPDDDESMSKYDETDNYQEEGSANNTVVYEIKYPTSPGNNSEEILPTPPKKRRESYTRPATAVNTEILKQIRELSQQVKKPQTVTDDYASAYGKFVCQMIRMYPIAKGSRLIGNLNEVIINFVQEDASNTNTKVSDNTSSEALQGLSETTDDTEH